jgi:hypothetical protein
VRSEREGAILLGKLWRKKMEGGRHKHPPKVLFARTFELGEPGDTDFVIRRYPERIKWRGGKAKD